MKFPSNNSSLLGLLVLYLACVSQIQSLMFYLPPNTRKCLKEEIHKDILVKGEFEITDIAGHQTKLEVTDSKNHILYNKDDAKVGKFAFTTDEYDVFQVCFETKVLHQQRGMENLIKEVSIKLKHGSEAKDYENVSGLVVTAMSAILDLI